MLISLGAKIMECDGTDSDGKECKKAFRRSCRYEVYLNGVEQLKRISSDTGKGRCPLCFDEEDDRHILLDCLENVN